MEHFAQFKILVKLKKQRIDLLGTAVKFSPREENCTVGFALRDEPGSTHGLILVL